MGFLVAFRLAVSQVSQGQGQGSELRVQEYAGGGGSGSVGKSTVVAYAHMSDRQFGFSPVGASRIVRNPKLQDLWYRTGLSYLSLLLWYFLTYSSREVVGFRKMGLDSMAAVM